MAFSEVIPLDTVLSNHLGLYQVTLSNWGNIGTAADANSVVSPIFEFPLGGIAIDPESTVERVILRPVVNGFLNSSGQLSSFDIPLDKDNPLTGRLSFPRIKGFSGGWGLVAPQIDRWGDEFRQLDGTTGPFGAVVSSPAIFSRPELRLIMTTDAGKPDISVPRRYPMRITRVFSALAAEPSSILFAPISGRKELRIVAYQTLGNDPATLFIRGVTGSRIQPPLTFLDPVEFELAPDLTVNDPTGENVSVFVDELICNYIHLVAEGAEDASMTVYVEARD